MRYPIPAAAATLLGFSCFVDPGTHTQMPRQDPQKAQFVLEAGTYPLKEFLLKCASHLGWNLLLDGTDFQNPMNTIDIQKTIRVDTKGCQEVMTTLALVRDFAIVPVDVSKNMYQAIFVRGPRRPTISTSASFMSPLEVKQHARAALPVVTVVRLKHISATKATNTVRPFFAGAGAGAASIQIGNAGDDESVLLAGFSNQVAQAMRLFEEVDQPSQQPPSTRALERLAVVEKQLADVQKRLARLEKAATKER